MNKKNKHQSSDSQFRAGVEKKGSLLPSHLSLLQVITGASIVATVSVSATLALTFGLVSPELIKQAWATSIAKLIEGMSSWLPALVGLAILLNELRLKRKLQEQELEFNKMKFGEERKASEDHRQLIEHEAASLHGVSEQLAKKIILQLKSDTQWASEAIERAKLGPFSRTIFGDRYGHFYDEKRFLAEKFLPLLLDRCRTLIEQGNQIYMLLDSGTTLYPFFSLLAQEGVSCRNNGEEWIEGLKIITNNLPGIESMLDHGRINPTDRYTQLAINCQILPGAPLPIYSAVIGELAEKAIHQLKDNASSERNIFIGLTTGNWVRIRKSEPACPVTLARGPGHLQFKQTLIDCSDEIYVIAPLGKIFVKFPLLEINQTLGFKDDHSDLSKRSYEEVLITDDKANAVNLVSTTRDYGRVLHRLSDRVKDALEFNDEIEQPLQLDKPRHLLWQYDPMSENWYYEIETEFPHPYTRRQELMQKYFFVPKRTPESRKKED